MADILVAALSARALASSARAAGYRPLAADMFCDADLEAAADRCARIAGDLDTGLLREPLLRALADLAEGRAPVGIVCGSGFEDRPALLAEVAACWPLVGNAAAQVARAKDPAFLADLCERLAIPHPRWREGTGGEGWVAKRRGGSGGTHVGKSAAGGDGIYWQERVEGEAVAALVLGSAGGAMVIGLSSQWSDPTADAPYRYGGAVRPAAIAEETAGELRQAAAAVVAEAGLQGLNSVDFLVSPRSWHLIEVNPRPGATLDIFEPDGSSLFALHMQACRGQLPAEPPALPGAAAARVVYARRAVDAVPEIAWPDWSADRQAQGSSVPADAPFCTVVARAADAAAARGLVQRRGDALLRAAGAD